MVNYFKFRSKSGMQNIRETSKTAEQEMAEFCFILYTSICKGMAFQKIRMEQGGNCDSE